MGYRKSSCFEWFDNGKGSGYAWVQRGNEIDGEAAYDYSGYSVSLSAKGNIVAIGAPDNDNGGGINSGHVRVFAYVGNNWIQIGNDIDGVAAGGFFGGALSLSSDGKFLAIGAKSDSNGIVRVYEIPFLIQSSIETDTTGKQITITYNENISGSLSNNPVLRVNNNTKYNTVRKKIEGKKIILTLQKNILPNEIYYLEYNLAGLTGNSKSLYNINNIITNNSTFDWFTENQKLKNKNSSMSFLHQQLYY